GEERTGEEAGEDEGERDASHGRRPGGAEGRGGLLERRIELPEAGERRARDQRDVPDEVGERQDHRGADEDEAAGPRLIRAERRREGDREDGARERPGEHDEGAEEPAARERLPGEEVGSDE